jgi:hypothetical protein
LQRSDPPNTEAREFLLGHAMQIDNVERKYEQSANQVKTETGFPVGSIHSVMIGRSENNLGDNWNASVTEIDGMSLNIADSHTISDQALLNLSLGGNVNLDSTAEAFDVSKENVN